MLCKTSSGNLAGQAEETAKEKEVDEEGAKASQGQEGERGRQGSFDSKMIMGTATHPVTVGNELWLY